MSEEALNHAAQAATLKTVSELATGMHLDHLVSIRQSADKSILSIGEDSGLSQFGKMASHTIDRHDVKNLPGAETIKALATDLVRPGPEGDRLRSDLNAHTMMDLATSRRNAVAYLIVVDSEDGKTRVGWLLSVFSAAKAQYKTETDEHGNVKVSLDNSFTQVVINLVTKHNVRSLHVGPFHRLVRDSEIGAQLGGALKSAGAIVYYDGGVIKPGSMDWQVQCLVAEQQYKAVVKGMSMGTYAKLMKGAWSKSEGQLPAVGYKFRSATDATVVPDETKRELIADLIRWAADPTLTWSEIARRLHEEHGHASEVHKTRQGEHVTIKDARGPETAVKNLLAVGLPLWLTGKYRYVSRKPRILEVDELPDAIAKKMVQRGANDYMLVQELDFHHEELSEPWGDPDTIKKGIRRLAGLSNWTRTKVRENFIDPAEFDAIAGDVEITGRKPTGRAAAATSHKPLAGLAEWADAEWQYAISARTHSYYGYVRRPIADATLPNGNRAGWRDRDLDILGTMLPEEIHKALAEAIVHAIDEAGVRVDRSPTRRKAAAKVKSDPAALQALQDKVTELSKKVAAGEMRQQIAEEDGLVETLKSVMRELEPLRSELRNVTEQLAIAQAAAQEARTFDTDAHAELGSLAAALAALAKTKKDAPGELGTILHNFLHDLRFHMSDDGLFVHFTVRVKVATSDGFVFLGPITGRVANHRRQTRVHRRHVMFERMFKLGEDFDTAARAAGYTDTMQAKRGLHDYLTQLGLVTTKGLRSAILDCPIPVVRQILWAEHVARTEGSVFKVPDGVDKTYAEHIRSVYTSDRDWALSWMVDNPGRARHAVDMVLAAADLDEGIEWDTVWQGCGKGLNAGGVRYLKEELVRGKGATSDGPDRFRIVYAPVIEARFSIQSRSRDKKVRARKCPFCDKRTLTHVVRVPEVLGGMLCTECRRSPHTPAVVFPQDYLRMWVGPRGVGMGKNGGPGHGTKEVK